VSWRKYLAIQTRVFPILSTAALLKLKESFYKCQSYKNGRVRNVPNDYKISFEDYNSIKLWFESDAEEASTNSRKRFNRPQKMKRTIFCISIFINRLRYVFRSSRRSGTEKERGSNSRKKSRSFGGYRRSF
jgi:hypothetical protein